MSAAPRRPVQRRKLLLAGCALALLAAAAGGTGLLLTAQVPSSSPASVPAPVVPTLPQPAPPERLRSLTPTVASDGRFTIRLLGTTRGP